MADLPTEININEKIKPTEFLTVAPRDKMFNYFNIQPIKLKVIQTKGVEVTPQVNIKVNEFNKGYNQFVNNSGDADRFKIDIIIHEDETVTGTDHISIHNKGIDLNNTEIMNTINSPYLNISTEDEDIEEDIYEYTPLTYVLNYWIKTATPLMVVTQAIDITDGEYIIVENSSRKQTYHEHTIWTLEFVKYNVLEIGTFKKSSEQIRKAIAKYNAKKNKKTNKAKNKAKETASLKKKLKKCKRTSLVYSKKKKVVSCVKTMQQLLVAYSCYPKTNVNQVDGWFGNMTLNAVKKFQKRYKTKYKLKVTGKVDSATFKALYTGGSATVVSKTAKQVGKTINLK